MSGDVAKALRKARDLFVSGKATNLLSALDRAAEEEGCDKRELIRTVRQYVRKSDSERWRQRAIERAAAGAIDDAEWEGGRG